MSDPIAARCLELIAETLDARKQAVTRSAREAIAAGKLTAEKAQQFWYAIDAVEHLRTVLRGSLR